MVPDPTDRHPGRIPGGTVAEPPERRDADDPRVAPLDAFGAGDLATAGGKGANLGELLAHGLAVPPGFVVTTAAYAAVVAAAGLTATIAERLAGVSPGDLDGVARAGAAIRAEFTRMALPAELRESVIAAYRALGGPPVAVRSSATAEDLPGAAFAGQQDTLLNVAGEEQVLDAVRACWASLWTDRAIAYRARLGIDPAEVSIAVVVQQMIAAEAAGVMFSANPVTGARDEVVVDASPGLGEAVVSGRVTPDHYVLDTAGAVRGFRPGRRELVIRAEAGGGTVTERPADDAAGESERLPAAVLRELAGIARRSAAVFGGPQDMEWALAEGAVWLVQSRPLTAVPPPPVRVNRVQRFIGPVILEMFGYRPYPLDMSAWIRPGPGRMVERMMRELPGLRLDFDTVLPEVDGVVDRYVPPLPRPSPAVLTAPARLARRIRRYDPDRWREDPRFESFLRRVEQLNAEAPAELDWAGLSARPRTALELVDQVTELRIDYLAAVGYSLVRLRFALRRLGMGTLAGPLGLGGHTRTQDANRALAELAAEVRADPELRALVTGQSPGDAAAADAAERMARLHREPEFAAFSERLRAFLADYGHRETASVLLLSAPAWADDPATVLGALAALVDEGGAPAADGTAERPAEGERPAERAMAELLRHPALAAPRRRRRMQRLVDAARAGVAFREDTHFEFSRVMLPLRRTFVEMGRRLADAGVLRSAEDVWHLRLEELEHLPPPAEIEPALADRLRGSARTRAAARAARRGAPLVAPGTLFAHTDDGDALVRGAAGGGGRTVARVRIVADTGEFGRLRNGEVLVCPHTNPAWTPLFQRAAAVVVDTGGVASHAAIVAREYGIPAVMGTGRATAVLRDGQRVVVDGDAGTVTEAEGD